MKLPSDVTGHHRQLGIPNSSVLASRSRVSLRRWADGMSRTEKPSRVSARLDGLHMCAILESFIANANPNEQYFPNATILY